MALKNWWDVYCRNIEHYCRTIIDLDASPIFFVLQKAVASQVATCYYSGESSETTFSVRGKAFDKARLCFEAGFSISEDTSGFNVKSFGEPAEPNKKLTLFAYAAKVRTVWFRIKRQVEKVWLFDSCQFSTNDSNLIRTNKPVKQPQFWASQGQTQTSSASTSLTPSSEQPGEVQTTNAHACSVDKEYLYEEFIRVSDIFTLYHTSDDKYYGHFHGMDLPDEVMIGDNGTVGNA